MTLAEPVRPQQTIQELAAARMKRHRDLSAELLTLSKTEGESDLWFLNKICEIAIREIKARRRKRGEALIVDYLDLRNAVLRGDSR